VETTIDWRLTDVNVSQINRTAWIVSQFAESQSAELFIVKIQGHGFVCWRYRFVRCYCREADHEQNQKEQCCVFHGRGSFRVTVTMRRVNAAPNKRIRSGSIRKCSTATPSLSAPTSGLRVVAFRGQRCKQLNNYRLPRTAMA